MPWDAPSAHLRAAEAGLRRRLMAMYPTRFDEHDDSFRGQADGGTAAGSGQEGEAGGEGKILRGSRKGGRRKGGRGRKKKKRKKKRRMEKWRKKKWKKKKRRKKKWRKN